ncbi:protein of unknown function [Burkholderia multivorans]
MTIVPRAFESIFRFAFITAEAILCRLSSSELSMAMIILSRPLIMGALFVLSVQDLAL